MEGRLIVSYHQKTEWYADGWDGALKDAEIETFTGAEPESPPAIEPVATWFIEHDLSKPEQTVCSLPAEVARPHYAMSEGCAGWAGAEPPAQGTSHAAE